MRKAFMYWSLIEWVFSQTSRHCKIIWSGYGNCYVFDVILKWALAGSEISRAVASPWKNAPDVLARTVSSLYIMVSLSFQPLMLHLTMILGGKCSLGTGFLFIMYGGSFCPSAVTAKTSMKWTFFQHLLVLSWLPCNLTHLQFASLESQVSLDLHWWYQILVEGISPAIFSCERSCGKLPPFLCWSGCNGCRTVVRTWTGSLCMRLPLNSSGPFCWPTAGHVIESWRLSSFAFVLPSNTYCLTASSSSGQWANPSLAFLDFSILSNCPFWPPSPHALLIYVLLLSSGSVPVFFDQETLFNFLTAWHRWCLSGGIAAVHNQIHKTLCQ